MPATAHSRRTLIATFGCGFFSLSLSSMASVVLPLWALYVGASPFWIGVVIGARQMLPMLYVLRGGVLIDRLGPRRVLMAVAVIGMVLAPLHPMLPWVAPLVLLQLAIGLAYSNAWVGAQTQLSQIAPGDARMAGRFNMFTTLGAFGGPLLAGVVWEHLGPWFAFALMALWASGLLVAAWALPVLPPRTGTSHPPLRPRDFAPRLSDYLRAFQLALMPVVMFTLIISWLRSTAYGVRSSFYPVYLESVAMGGTEIGFLMAIAELVAAPTGLALGWLARRYSTSLLAIVSMAVMVVSLLLTPLVEGMTQFIILAALFGFGTGVNLPVLLSMMSHSVDPTMQGLGVGLRVGVNLVAMLVTPVIMGIVVEATDLADSFLWICGSVLALTALATILFRGKTYAAVRERSGRP